MARWRILGALFFAQSVIDLFSVEQAIELAGFAIVGLAAQKHGQMTVWIVARRPIARPPT
jgi:hypothetical protein